MPGAVPTLDYERVTPVSPWRTRVALILCVPLGLAAGLGVSSAGFGFFPVWFSLTLACPAVLCIITTSRHVLIAVLCPIVMMTFVVAAGVLHPGPYGPHPPGVFVILGVLTLLSVAFAVGIGRMFSDRQRRRFAQRSVGRGES